MIANQKMTFFGDIVDDNIGLKVTDFRLPKWTNLSPTSQNSHWHISPSSTSSRLRVSQFPSWSDWSVVLPFLSFCLVSMTKNISTIMHFVTLHLISPTSLINSCESISNFWLHRCWWRMLEEKYVGDKFEMLVTVFAVFDTNILYLLTLASSSPTRAADSLSPISKFCH